MSLFLGPLSYCINLCVYFCAGIITVLINYSFLVLFEAKEHFFFQDCFGYSRSFVVVPYKF